MRQSKEEYAKRIEQATPLQLTLINYELLLHAIDDARAAAAKSDDCKIALDKARECLATLYTTLDMDVEFSKDLANLYLFVNQSIIHAGLKRSDDEKNQLLDDAFQIMTQLSAAWLTLADDENLADKLADGERRFAGLTYGKDGQLEEYQDFDPDRGYKA